MVERTCKHRIEEIRTRGPISIVSPEDFKIVESEEINPELVLEDSAFSLYCFDPANRTALFIQSGDPVALNRAPFYYQGQRQTAIAMVSMPLDDFHRLAGTIKSPPKGVIFVHSVGRCGSTLISKVLDAVPSVHSYSEPDDLTQLNELWGSGALDDQELRELLASSIRMRCKVGPNGIVDQVAIKPRSEVMVLAEQIGSLFPTDKHFFMYRNGIAWMQTIFRGFSRDVYDEAKIVRWKLVGVGLCLC